MTKMRTVSLVQLFSFGFLSSIYGIQIIDNQSLNTYPISCLKGFDFSRCLLECLYVTLCKSFSYKKHVRECLLFNSTQSDPPEVYLYQRAGYSWVDATRITEFQVVQDDPCSSRPCGLHQRCYPTSISPSYLCRDVDCGDLPSKGELPTDTYILPGNTSIGTIRSYYCNSRRRIAYVFKRVPGTDCQHTASPTCMSNFQWADVTLECSRRSTVFDCESVRACNAGYGDGEYWIYQDGVFEYPIKVYCHNMSGTPAMYLTLGADTNNYAMITYDGNIPQRTQFQRIRIEPYWFRGFDYSTLKIILDDFAFSTSTESSLLPIQFGTTGGCYINSVKMFGEFNVNLTGTTFKLSGDNSWEPTDGSVEKEGFSLTSYTASGRCWSSDCNVECAPATALSIMVDQEHGVPQSSATKPTCP